MKLILHILFFLTFNVCCALGNPIDSMKQALERATNDAEILAHISEKSQGTDTLSRVYATLGLEYAKRKELSDWQIVFHLNKAHAMLGDKDKTPSIRHSFQALQLMDAQAKEASERGWAYSLLARGLEGMGAYREAIKYRQKQLQWIQKDTIDHRIPTIYAFIGALFLELNELDTAVFYYGKVLENKIDSRDGLRNTAGTYNNIGLVYLKAEKIDSAQKYFELSLGLYKNGSHVRDSLMVGIVSGNLSECLPLKGNEERKVALLSSDIRICKGYNAGLNLVKAYKGMAELQRALKQYPLAQTYMDSCLSYCNALQENTSKQELRLEIFQAYVNLCQDQQQFKKALEYSKLRQEVLNDLYGEEVKKQLIISRSTYQAVAIQQELELEKALLNESQERINVLEKESQLSNLRILLIVIIAVFLLIFAWFNILKMKSDHKKKQKIEQLSKRMLEASIANKTERLTQTALSLTRKKEFAEHLMEQLASIKGIDKKLLHPIQSLVSNELYIDESILEMEQYIADLSKDFFVKIKLHFPQLTENDMKLCGLIRLKLSNKQIATIKNIAPESVKISKNRLSKKLKLENATQLLDFLKQF